MKKVNIGFVIILTLIFLVSLINCNKDLEVDINDEITDIDINDIIPLTRLLTNNILDLDNATQVKYGDKPWGHTYFEDNYVAKFEFRWENEDYIYIEEYITESNEIALKYLLEKHKWYTNPFIEEMKDEPAIVGNISYSQGREFIRNNIIIIIHASGEFEKRLTEIAKQVDKEILKSITFTSIDQVKPRINRFEITQNPVKELSETQLIIDIHDPNNRNIFYNWRFHPGSFYGGIQQDEDGNYYYTATFAYDTIPEIELTLIVTNDYGFCSDSTIYIQIEPEDKTEENNMPCP